MDDAQTWTLIAANTTVLLTVMGYVVRAQTRALEARIDGLEKVVDLRLGHLESDVSMIKNRLFGAPAA